MGLKIGFIRILDKLSGCDGVVFKKKKRLRPPFRPEPEALTIARRIGTPLLRGLIESPKAGG
jgi:hypothetical protein